MSECSEMNVLECNLSEDCEWIEDAEYGNCSSLGESACDANPNCTYDCGMYHGSCAGCCWGDCLGGTYTIYDNSYCHDINEPVECSDFNESSCSSNDDCEWIDDIESINCNTLSDNLCTSYNAQALGNTCWLQQGDCLEWGSWYTWMCYTYDYQWNRNFTKV